MRIVVTGANGQLGRYLVDHLEAAGLAVQAWSHEQAVQPLQLDESSWTAVDITNQGEVEKALDETDPDIVFHLAAISSADAVFRNPTRGFATNVEATRRLADWCRGRCRRIILTSTDLVFDGTGTFYREEDEANPILLYGRTKLEAERAVLETQSGLVARLSLLYGFARSNRLGFFDRAISALRQGNPQSFFEDEYRTPLDYGTASAILSRLALSSFNGLIHVAGPQRMSRWELMRTAAESLGLDPNLVHANRRVDVTLPEPRPADVSLDTTRLLALYPELEDATIQNALAQRNHSHPDNGGTVFP